MRRHKHFAFNAIKESFDMLPTAVCFFDCSGGIVLCNRQMYRLSRYLLDSDMQYLGEVEQALLDPPDDILRFRRREASIAFRTKPYGDLKKRLSPTVTGKRIYSLPPQMSPVCIGHWYSFQPTTESSRRTRKK